MTTKINPLPPPPLITDGLPVAAPESDDILLPCRICGKEYIQSRAFRSFVPTGVPCDECHAKHRAGFGYDYIKREWYILPEKSRVPVQPEVANWHNACPAAYLLTEDARLPATLLAKVLNWKMGPRGLIIHGPSDTCKTRCLFQLLKRVILTERRTARIFFCDQWADFVARNCKGDDDAMRAKRELLDVDVLVFDDLFAEKFTDRAESVLLGVLDQRLREMKPILATTMYTGDGLERAGKFVDPIRAIPILRRLRQGCDAISFKPTTATK